MLAATRHSALRAARLSTVAQRRLASTLVFLEQKGGKLNNGSLSAVTAAKSIGGDVSIMLSEGSKGTEQSERNVLTSEQVSGVVVGSKADIDGVLEEVKKCVGTWLRLQPGAEFHSNSSNSR